MVTHSIGIFRSDDPAVITEHWLDCTAFAPKRICKGPYDFGDVNTVLRHLKSARHDIRQLVLGDMDAECTHGVFGGQIHGRWVVFVKGMQQGIYLIGLSQVAMAKIRMVIGYETLEDLKRDWSLD